MIKNIKNIIEGWFKHLFKSQSSMAKERLSCCKCCEHNIDNWCELCGCYLPAKAEVESEVCHANKWNV